jgi:hypothetical protein
MDDELRALAHEVFGLLEGYIAVHNDMLGRKGLTWLKAIDFEGNAQKLAQIHQGLEAARSRALALASSTKALVRHREYLQVLVGYVEALSYTVGLLQKIATNLSQKARGAPYAMSQYLQDMDTYEASVSRYTTVGETLKAAWDRAGL